MHFRKIQIEKLVSFIIGLMLGSLALATPAAIFLRADLPTGSHLRPTAVVLASHSVATPTDIVTFDASGSRSSSGDTRGLSYRFDFESTYAWTAWSTNPRASHIFTRTGVRTTRVQVRDAAGFIDETSVSVTVREQTGAPRVSFAVTPTEGTTSTPFRFTVTPLSAINTPLHQMVVRIDYEGDGVWDTDWSTAREFIHTYPVAGSRQPRVEVRDGDGRTAAAIGYRISTTKNTGRIVIKEVLAPRAALSLYPLSGQVGIIAHFDASTSTRASVYRFDFDGDGRFDTEWQANPRVQHRYDHVGEYEPIVEVRSSDQRTDRTTRVFTVVGENFEPSAELRARNRSATATDGSFGQLLDEFLFDASGSRDADSTRDTFRARFDFDGDNVWDTPFSTDFTATHRYTQVGLYTPSVQVMDADGLTANTTGPEIRIVMNTKPQAAFFVTPDRGMMGDEFVFDATRVVDGQETASRLQARFDFDGDGRWDTDFTTSKRVTAEVAELGRRTAVVEVRDSRNATTRATATFETVAPLEPIARFTASPDIGTFATNFRFDASGSVDPSGVAGPLEYRWDFGSGGTSDIIFDTGWSTSPIATRRFDVASAYPIHLVVRNRADQTADVFHTIVVHPDSSSLDYLAARRLMASEAPDQPMTRAEWAKLVVTASGIIPPRRLAAAPATDVDPAAWYAPYVAVALARDWMTTTPDGAFRPDVPVTRAAAVTSATPALLPTVAPTVSRTPWTDVPTRSQLARYGAVARQIGYLDDRARLAPGEAVVRGEAARLVALYLQAYDMPAARAAARPAATARSGFRLFGADVIRTLLDLR